jgi:hypothetical protein
MQQPEHVPGPHFVPEHVRDVELHAMPSEAQCWQGCALVPHSSGSVPARHSAFSQQPVGHVFGSQLGTVLPHACTR